MEQADRVMHREDMEFFGSQPINNTVGALNDLTNQRIGDFRDDPSRLWKQSQAIDCRNEALGHQLGCRWGILCDELLDALNIGNRSTGSNEGHPQS